jgi:ribosomal protein S18 acetylase RimI-like enzyme
MLTIKPAGLSDVLLINELAHRIWPIAYKNIISADQMEYMLDLIYSPSSLKKQIKSLAHKFVIVYNDKRPVGFASYCKKLKSTDTFKLHKVYILQSEHGKGMGKLVLENIIADIQPNGAKFLELNVNRNNKAVEFYKKLGFRIIAEEDIDIDNGYFMNDYIMRKKL